MVSLPTKVYIQGSPSISLWPIDPQIPRVCSLRSFCRLIYRNWPFRPYLRLLNSIYSLFLWILVNVPRRVLLESFVPLLHHFQYTCSWCDSNWHIEDTRVLLLSELEGQSTVLPCQESNHSRDKLHQASIHVPERMLSLSAITFTRLYSIVLRMTL